MAEFHETVYGRRFFDHQLPALIRALERIASASEKSAMETKITNLMSLKGGEGK